PFEHAGRTEQLPLQQVNAKLYDPDRTAREAAAKAMTRGLQDNARLLTFLFNTLVLDHRTDCNLRRFDDPMAPRHLANAISPAVPGHMEKETGRAVVAALMRGAGRHHVRVQRYYRPKVRLLGFYRLKDYDRYAPLFPDQPTCDWPTARRIVQESYEAFSPDAG